MKTDSTRPTIAYLAPEIPGASSTFVYNEIIELEKLAIDVHPYSLHEVDIKVNDQKVKELAGRCEYLYRTPKSHLLKSHFNWLTTSPRLYLKALFSSVIDALRSIKQPQVAAGLLYRFFISAYLAQRLTKNRAQHLHCHFSHIAADVGMYAAMISGISYSFTAHANDIFQRAYLLREKGRRAKFVATISEHNICLLKKKGIPAEKLRLVRCGVDTEKFTPRVSKNKDSKEKTIGFLGRLVEKKGVDILIRAAPIIVQFEQNVRIEIMGEGPLEKELRALAVDLGVDRNITFGGALPHDQVSSWFERIDYFVFPGKIDSHGDMDGIPVVLMEAMMRGVPVIATAISGIPELVRNRHTGRLTNAVPEDLAREIKRALSETESEKAEMADRAIKHVEAEFNLADNAKLLADHMLLNANERSCQTSLPC